MNTCRTCKRPDINEIDALLMQATPLRNIVERFKGTTMGGLSRHNNECLVYPTNELHEKKRNTLLDELAAIRQEIIDLHSEFPDNGTVRTALVARRLEAFDKEAKLTGAYQQDRKNETDLGKELAEKWGLPGEKIQEIAEKFEQ